MKSLPLHTVHTHAFYKQLLKKKCKMFSSILVKLNRITIKPLKMFFLKIPMETMPNKILSIYFYHNF